MSKINKVYPSFFNGVSQQSPELVLDNQCKEMINCVPDLVQGLQKRPPVKYVGRRTNLQDAHVFHTYDRGEDNEEYIFLATEDPADPIRAFNKAGQQMTVVYADADVKTYLSNGDLKALTVQDRTWMYSKSAVVSLDYTATTPLNTEYTKTAYYWIKRGSGDRYNPFNYAVYLNGTTADVAPNPPSNETPDPDVGAEDSNVAAEILADKINGTDISGQNPGLLSVAGFTAVVDGSILKIYRPDGADFTFSSWDSWGNQASEGFKGSVQKITDLPKDFPAAFGTAYFEIIGKEGNTSTNYFVKWNGSSWEECLDPAADRGQLANMPVKCDRTALVGGVATFTIDFIDWSLARVGNEENNPDPSFVGRKVQEVFFHKNRLGIASEDSIVLSETANYTNFYPTTAIDIVDTDMIDVSLSSNQASKIYHVKPFNNSLYLFTKFAQYELIAEGIFSPSTVAIVNTSNYPMSIDVEPVVMNDSLYFISNTNNQQQLREYIKTDRLNVKGVDLNISTPTYLEDKVTKLIVDGVLGFVLCTTATNKIYLYNFKEDGEQRVQSAWSTWKVLEGLTAASYEYFILASDFLIMTKNAAGNDYRYHKMVLDWDIADDNVDESYDSETYSYESKLVLPDYYPQLGTVRTPLNKVLLKKAVIGGSGQFDADVYRKDYNTTYTKTHDKSLADLDLHISSKVGNVEITIKDSSELDFRIDSVVLEGLYTPTSKEIK